VKVVVPVVIVLSVMCVIGSAFVSVVNTGLPPNAKIASYLQPLQLFVDFIKLLLVLMMTVMTVIMWDALLARNISH
jgi:hypothetical protein